MRLKFNIGWQDFCVAGFQTQTLWSKGHICVVLLLLFGSAVGFRCSFADGHTPLDYPHFPGLVLWLQFQPEESAEVVEMACMAASSKPALAAGLAVGVRGDGRRVIFIDWPWSLCGDTPIALFRLCLNSFFTIQDICISVPHSFWIYHDAAVATVVLKVVQPLQDLRFRRTSHLLLHGLDRTDPNGGEEGDMAITWHSRGDLALRRHL